MGNAPGQPHLSPQSIHHSYAQPAHGIDKGEAPLPHLLVGEHVHTFKPTDEELRKLQAQFRSLKVSHGGTVAERLNREAFHHNFAKKLKPQFIDKIFNALDWDHSGVVSFREFVMLTHILFAGTEDEKIDYLFVLYDSNGDGFLSGPEIARLAHGCSAALRSLLRSLDSEKQLPLPTTPAEKEAAEKKFAAAILEEADKDGDGKLSADEFKTYCKKHPQALQELQQLADILRHLLGNEVQLVHKPSPKVARANPTEAAEAGKAGGSPKIPHALEAGVAPGTMTTIANVANLLSPNPIPPLEPPAPAPRPADADFALEREAHKLAHKGGSLDKLAS